MGEATAAAIKRKIVFVTGTRADFGKLEPLALTAHESGFGVTFFVTGMHMMDKYGLTKLEVHQSGVFDVVEYINQRDGDPQDMILAKTVIGFSDFLQELKPDLVVIHGDRVEALACALVCAMNYVLCAHVEGGEVSGTIDEMFRHCNTKLSSVHLVSSQQARKRVIRLGEAPASVEVIGSPEIDIHGQPSGVTIEEVRERYAITAREYGVCIFHPVTSEIDTIGQQAASLFSTLAASGRHFIVILPNNDPGSDEIVAEIRKLPDDRFRILPSMRFNYFSELLKNASLVVGNSSLGAREAPFLGIPSLDVGTRQSNRSNAPSLSKASPFDTEAITRFLGEAWGKRFDQHLAFGAGQSRARFLELISSESFWRRPPQKYFDESIVVD